MFVYSDYQEDFQPVMYGYKLANEIPVGKATAMLKEVEEELSKKVKVTNPILSSHIEKLFSIS